LSADETPPRSSPFVSARDVLNALSEIRRRGQWPLLQELEPVEPDLTSYILEELSLIHGTLVKTGAKAKGLRRAQRQVQSLVLVCVLSLRARPENDPVSTSHVPPAP
jgi:hypothetical protein